jgi:ribosome maturation factor RimP
VTDLATSIERIAGPSLEAMGYEVVRVQFTGQRRPTLQVMAERKDGAAMTVEDCTAISRALSALLDVEDPIPSAYDLEVSSPGIDRPLTRAKDYARFAGHEARIETRSAIDGRRRFRGRILGLEQDRVRIAAEEGEAAIPLGEIQKAKLVLTDALIAAVEADTNRQN